MGLFGGFKAKFTRNSTAKSKPQEVVCLKYHVHTEFDRQDPPITIPVANNIKKNEVVRKNSKTKARKALAKSAIFQDDTSNTSTASSSFLQKSKSLTNLNGDASKPIRSFDNKLPEPSNSITISTTIEVPNNTKSIALADTKIDRNIGEFNGVVTENVIVKANNHMYSSNSNIKTEKHEQTVLKTFSKQNEATYKEKEVNGHNEKSTLIFMTQHSSETYEKNEENGEDNFGLKFSSMSNRTFKPNNTRIPDDTDESDEEPDGNFKINFVPNKSFDEQNDYKINHVKHDLNRSYSYSDDEKSYQEEPMQFTKMGFSSQAASIFFGEDVEPEVQRPRKILLKDEDEDDDDDSRRSSGADC